MASPILFLDGTDQRVIFELATASPSDDPVYRGTSDGAALTNCNLKFKQFGGAWSTILSPTITWDETGQFWEATIPHGLITSYGHAVIIVLSTNSAFATLNILVTIVPPNSYFATAAALATVDTVVDSLATTEELVSIGLDIAAIKVVTDSGLATSAEITSIKGATWTDETLVTIQAAAGGTDTGGSESIITSYTLDASEKTIDTTDTTLTIEQIKYILNLTTGNEIYDSSNPRKRRLQMTAPADQVGIDISITSGVISYIESSAMTDDDKIKVVVESAHV